MKTLINIFNKIQSGDSVLFQLETQDGKFGKQSFAP